MSNKESSAQLDHFVENSLRTHILDDISSKIANLRRVIEMDRCSILRTEEEITDTKVKIRTEKENISIVGDVTFSAKQKEVIEKVLGKRSVDTLCANDSSRKQLEKLKGSLRALVARQIQNKRYLGKLINFRRNYRKYINLLFEPFPKKKHPKAKKAKDAPAGKNPRFHKG
jgi:hypothetical protein